MILDKLISASSLPYLYHNNTLSFCLGCNLLNRNMDNHQDSPLESASSNSQPSTLHPNRLPPRPEKGAKERTPRSAQEVLKEYKECTPDEKKCMH
jgi:hypothetical protein